MNTKSNTESMGENGEHREGKRIERAEIKMLGPISYIAPHEGLWTGSISRKAHQSERVTGALQEIPHYFVMADTDAPERCIDGRPKVKKGARGHLQEMHLGPQTPGGTPAMTLAYRIMNAGTLPEGKKFCDDLKDTIGLCKKHGISFGGHIDDHNHGFNCGCGAIDKIPEIFKKILEPEFKESASVYLKAILGERFDADVMQSLIGRADELNAQNGNYLEQTADGDYLFRKKVIETLETEATNVQPVEELIGDHREIALVVNLVPGSTFDRDAFTKAQGSEVQAFNYDFWVSEDFANKLFKSEKKRTEFLTIRAMLGIATAMVLTDGSMELILRTKK
ncbi:hypothetical protein EPO14_02995 [Patescibacteria group bacterium]|nr:MAG: hypothetical protein EPO14_02995 [Patescibacteria group bacterium]